MKTTGYFVSDLHMFAKRSEAERHEQAIQEAAARADLFVLGGDIFDFRWSTVGGHEETIDQGMTWLIEMVERNRNCQFHYVLGNHDHCELLIRRLDQLAASNDRFAWHPYYMRIEDKLFLHGDVADREMDQEDLTRRRARWPHHKQHGPLAGYTYDAAIFMRLHKVIMKVAHSPDRVASRISAYLNSIGHGPASGLQHVYFGHTHHAMSNYHYGGLTFHNCGAPLKGLEFQLVPFEHE
jgi:UDP-2,3-diacylglucosamine hydrolase